MNAPISKKCLSGRRAALLFGLFVLLMIPVAYQHPQGKSLAGDSLRPGDDALLKAAQDVLKPLPPKRSEEHNAELVSLGRTLFFEPRASADGAVSCSRCHLPSLYATDALPKSLGSHDRMLPRNAPTVFNVALNFRQHWRGEFADVEDQAKHALLGMGFANPDYATAMARLNSIPGYDKLFRSAFPGEQNPITEDNWAKAIGAYERTLFTPSRVDEYLGGKSEALSVAESRGLRKFLDVGCAGCHHGAGIGGGLFEKFGVVEDYWKATGSKTIDKGRFELTKNPDDLYVFKVPGLRNVEMTPPYFSDGSVTKLPDAVRVMARVQLGVKLSDDEVNDVVAFLKSLTGKPPEDFRTVPELPPAGYRDVPPRD